MRQYLDLLQDVLLNGTRTDDRTGTGTLSVFGRQLRFNIADGFPLVTTKKVFWRGIVAELLWMISGDTNIKTLQEQGVHIWDEWADQDGDLGPVYGAQWRSWNEYEPISIPAIDGKVLHTDGTFVDGLYERSTFDQLAEVINSIKTNPTSRRHIVTAWNPTEVDEMALPPCHCFFQFHVRDKYLDLQLYQRSADLFLGVPFNIASYALLLMMVAQECKLIPGEFIHTFGDAHIYLNHIEQVKQQLTRTPLTLPNVHIDNCKWDGAPLSFFDIRKEHIHLIDYHHYPPIAGKVSV